MYDKYSSLSSQNASLKELATQAKLVEERVIKENTGLKTINEELVSKDKILVKKNVALVKKNKTLMSKLAAKEGKKIKPRGYSQLKYKGIAVKNQKIIDAQLKKLLALRGLKPVLKHE